MLRIANAQVWVHDQDEALEFNTTKVGMEVRADVTLPELGFRWLTVGPLGQPDVSIVLMAVPGPPVMDEETAEEVRSLTAKGFAGTVVLTTDDARPPTRRWCPRRRVHRDPREAPLRHRRRLPRRVGQLAPPDAADRLRAELIARRNPSTTGASRGGDVPAWTGPRRPVTPPAAWRDCAGIQRLPTAQLSYS